MRDKEKYRIYQRNYQREYQRKKKLERQGIENKPEADKPEVKNEPEPDNPEIKNEEKITMPKAPKRRKGKVMRNPMTPESFGDFSVSADSLLVSALHKDKLKDYERDYIKQSGMQLAQSYQIPAMMLFINYGMAMTLPHVSRYVDKVNEKKDWEIKKIQAEIKTMGKDISLDELKTQDASKLLEQMKKESELKTLKGMNEGIKIED